MAGLFDEMMAYIQANTPRSTRPVAKPSTVINQGLLNPNKFNAPAANRLKDSLFGIAGIVPGVGDVASAAESADLFNRGEKFAGSVAALGALPLVPALGGMFIGKGAKTWDAIAAQHADDLLKQGVDPREVWKQTGTLDGPAMSVADDAGGLLGRVDNAPMSAPSVNDAGDILVDGKKVGRLKLDKSDGAVRIADIEISPTSQRKGYGSSVIQKVLDDADAQGLPVVLSTDAMRGKDAVQGQRKLYESLGFEKNKTLKTGGVKEEYVRHPKKK